MQTILSPEHGSGSKAGLAFVLNVINLVKPQHLSAAAINLSLMKMVLLMNHLELIRVSKSYRKNIHVLKDLSLQISSGEIYGMIGPNGAGKTTTVGIVTSLLRATSGRVYIKGTSPDKMKAKRNFGYVPDELLLPETLTGQEYLSFVARMYEIDDRERKNKLAELLHMDRVLPLLISEYSHGMKKKLQLIASMLHDPPLMILDEPFRGLDPEAVILFKKIMQHRRQQGKSILVATHDLLSAQVLCDRVGILSNGGLVAQGTVQALLKQYQTTSLEDVFMAASGLEKRGNDVDEIINHL